MRGNREPRMENNTPILRIPWDAGFQEVAPLDRCGYLQTYPKSNDAGFQGAAPLGGVWDVSILFTRRTKRGFQGTQPFGGVWGVPTFSLFGGWERKTGTFGKPCRASIFSRLDPSLLV